MCSYAGSDFHWGLQPHHEDMRSTEYSNYSLPVVVDSRDTTESRLVGVKKAEKEPDLHLIERAHGSTTMEDFEKRDAVDVEDPCCLTFAGRDIGVAADSVSERRGLVHLQNDHRSVVYVCSRLN
jgi:hypothetical protein